MRVRSSRRGEKAEVDWEGWSKEEKEGRRGRRGESTEETYQSRDQLLEIEMSDVFVDAGVGSYVRWKGISQFRKRKRGKREKDEPILSNRSPPSAGR